MTSRERGPLVSGYSFRTNQWDEVLGSLHRRETPYPRGR
jgi:hypothetical protein